MTKETLIIESSPVNSIVDVENKAEMYRALGFKTTFTISEDKDSASISLKGEKGESVKVGMALKYQDKKKKPEKLKLGGFTTVAGKPVDVEVEIIAANYIYHHGKKPAGKGNWGFGIGSRDSGDLIFLEGNYSSVSKRASELAQKKAKSTGKDKISMYVMESTYAEFMDVETQVESKGKLVEGILRVNSKVMTTTTGIRADAVVASLNENVDKFIAKTIAESTMSKEEHDKAENIVKGMKDKVSDFKKRYGDEAESVMHATANKLAKEDMTEPAPATGEDAYDQWRNELRAKHGAELYLKSHPSNGDEGNVVYAYLKDGSAEGKLVSGFDLDTDQPVSGLDESANEMNLDQWKHFYEERFPNVEFEEQGNEIHAVVQDRRIVGWFDKAKHGMNESVNSFQIDYEIKGTDGVSSGSANVQAPDANTARQRFIDDHKDQGQVNVKAVKPAQVTETVENADSEWMDTSDIVAVVIEQILANAMVSAQEAESKFQGDDAEPNFDFGGVVREQAESMISELATAISDFTTHSADQFEEMVQSILSKNGKTTSTESVKPKDDYVASLAEAMKNFRF